MRQCNECGRENCRIIRRARKDDVAPEIWRSSCSAYIPLTEMRLTLFEKSLFRNTQGLVDVLDSLKLKIEGANRHPWFNVVEAE